jgi:hypothetical protein
MNIVSYGAGTNSTALLIEMVNRGIPVDLITFADTGAERPQTYEYLKMFSDWLVTKGYPEIITLRAETPSKIGGIEQFCLTHKTLPSIAFGYKKCSQQFKGDPQDKFIKNHPMVKEVWARGEKVNKYIGYDADEPHRANRELPERITSLFNMKYPLVEWNMGRDECIESIKAAGLPLAGKSACFFCPSTKPREILEMKRTHPDLLKRALELEENAKESFTAIKGLGRNYSWAELVRADDAQMCLFTSEVPCECYDGD